QRHGGAAGFRIVADQGRAVGFDDDTLFGAAVIGPMHLALGNAHDVAWLAAPAASLDEEPDLAREDVVDLLGGMAMRAGMVARAALGEHDAVLHAVDALRGQHHIVARRRGGLGAAYRQRVFADAVIGLGLVSVAHGPSP